jgi:diaminopimelate epimerase
MLTSRRRVPEQARVMVIEARGNSRIWSIVKEKGFSLTNPCGQLIV